MSFLPHTPVLSAPATIGPSQHQASMNEKDSRSRSSLPPSPASMFPFPAEARAFSARIPDLASALYGLPYTSHASIYPGIPNLDPAAAFPAGLNRINHKDVANHWRPQVPHQGAILQHYDPTLAASLMYQGGYGSLALNDSGRRKNATRETTATLKAWLNEHRKNPYPTKGEKIMLAIVSKMTLTQVSTWFANARRRLKKENRMTWSPRNRCGDERMSEDEEVENTDNKKNMTTIGNPNGCSSEMINQQAENHHTEAPGHSQHLRMIDDEDREDTPTNPQESNFSPNLSSYNNIHTQLFLRHLVSLPPHLRPSDPLKFFQQQMQGQQFVEGRRAECDVPSLARHNSAPHQCEKLFSGDLQDSFKLFGRRSGDNSPGSPPNRSPSPSKFFGREPPALERAHPAMTHHDVMRRVSRGKSEDSPARHEKRANSPSVRDAKDAASTSGIEKKKFKIWSPLNLSDGPEKSPRQSNGSDTDLRYQMPMRRSSSVFTYDDDSLTHEGRSSPDRRKHHSSSPTTSSSSEKNGCGSPQQFNKTLMEEYQRQIAYRNLTAKTQQALAATLAGLAAKRRNGMPGPPLPHPEALALLQQQQQHQRAHFNLALPDIFSSELRSKEERLQSGNEDDEAVFSDAESSAPMNLTKSKSTPQRRDERPNFTLDDEDRKRIIPSIVAN